MIISNCPVNDNILYDRAIKNFTAMHRRVYSKDPDEISLSFGSFAYFLRYKGLKRKPKGYKNWWSFLQNMQFLNLFSFDCEINRVIGGFENDLNVLLQNNFLKDPWIDSLLDSRGKDYKLSFQVWNAFNELKEYKIKENPTSESFFYDFKKKLRIRKNSSKYEMMVKTLKPLLRNARFVVLKKFIEDQNFFYVKAKGGILDKEWLNRLNDDLIVLDNVIEISKILNFTKLQAKFESIIEVIRSAFDQRAKDIKSLGKILNKRVRQLEKLANSIDKRELELARKKLKEAMKTGEF